MAALFELLPQIGIDEREHHQPRIIGHFAHDPIEMPFGAHHRPEMAHHLDIGKLRERGFGNIFQRFPGGIRQ